MSIIKNTKELKIKKIFDLNGKNTLKRGPFGSALKKSFFVSTGFKVYEQKNAIRKNINDGDYYINENKYQELINFNLLPNDIIVSCSGTVGEVYMIPENAPEGVINQALLRIRLSKNDFPLYYYYYFSSSRFKSKLLQDAMGGVIKNISGMETLNNIEVIDISYEEQKKITKILKLQDDRLKNLKNLLEKIEIRNQYYADKLTSGQIKLNNSVSIINYKFDNIVNEHKKSKVMAGNSLKEGLYPFFNCSKKQTLFSNEYLIDDSVLLLSTGGTAAVNYYNGKLSYSTDVWCITSKYTKYLYYFYNANINKIEQCFQGGGLKHLSKKDFKNIEITIPNNDKDIQEIVDYLDKLNDEKEKVERLLKLEEQRFEWLSDKLLSGEYVIED